MSFLQKKYCRFCAETKEPNELLDFENNPLKFAEVRQRLSCFNVNNIDILNDNNLPKTVCLACDDFLCKAYEFFNKIERARDVLDAVLNIENSALNSVEFDDNPPSVDDILVEKKPDIKKEVEGDSDYGVEVEFDVKQEIDDSNDETCTVNLLKDCIFHNIPSWNGYIWHCQYCTKEFPSITKLRDHSKKFHKKCTAFKCSDCKMMVAEFDVFIRHVGRHRKDLRERCQYCDASLLKGLKRTHIQEHFKDNEVACTFCGEIFPDDQDLHDHMLEYVKTKAKRSRRKKNTPVPEHQLTCRICHKKFASMSVRNDHEKRHSKERKRDYTCERCGKAFYSKGTLVTHLNVHDQNKPHVCKICNKSFLFPNMLRKHVETHTDIKKFACDECGRAFRRPYQLKSHKIIHTDKMPYMCQFCSKSFKFAQILKNHERLHTGSKPYSCNICSSDFANWSNYNKHMVRRHGVDTAKKKITPDGIFPRNPETGQLMEIMSGEVKEWKDKMLAVKCVKGKKTVI